MTAAGALHSTPQREILADVFARWGIRALIEAGLNPLKRLEADQAFMLGLAQTNTPGSAFDHAGTERLVQQLRYKRMAEPALLTLGDGWLRFEEPHKLRLRLEPATSEAVEGFGQDGCERLIADEQLAVSFDPFEPIARHRRERPVAGAHARFHAVAGLLGILHPGMGTDGRQQMLDQLAVRVLSELDGRAFENTAGLCNRSPQRQMRIQSARKARDVIDEDADRLFAVFAKVCQQRLHAWPLDQRAGDGFVFKGLDDLIALEAGEVGASYGLTLCALPLIDLSNRRDTAIDDSLCCRLGLVSVFIFPFFF